MTQESLFQNVVFRQLREHPEKEDWTAARAEERLRGIIEELVGALKQEELRPFFFPKSPNLFAETTDFQYLIDYVEATKNELASQISTLTSQ